MANGGLAKPMTVLPFMIAPDVVDVEPLAGQSIETSRHFQRPHLARMPLAVEEDETLNSFQISLLGAEGVMFETHHFTTLVLQPQLGIGNAPSIGRCGLCGSCYRANIGQK